MTEPAAERATGPVIAPGTGPARGDIHDAHARASLRSMLESLRSDGARGFDPVRFRYLEALSARIDAQPAAVARILEQRLASALTEFAACFVQSRTAAADTVASLSARHPERARELRALLAAGDLRGVHRLGAGKPVDRCEPLAHLNADLRRAVAGDGERAPGEGASAWPEMRSVRRFRQAWSRILAEDRVAQALDRGPGNAGPLNSHMLVLRSLRLMRDLSPDYLRRFLSHVDTLLWLDQVGGKETPPQARPARRARQRK